MSDEVEAAVAARLREAAKDIHLWAHAMTTEKARWAATFAADRILELAGFSTDEADQVAREAHAEWAAQEAEQSQEAHEPPDAPDLYGGAR